MKLYNSLTKKQEVFTPITEGKVTVYVCGITPYDTTHLGHAFTYIFFDVLIRYLEFLGYSVTYTQNVTDINDRDNDILKRAQEQNVPWQNLANFWTDKFLHDMHTLNWRMPDNYLWASAHIPSMIRIIEKLLKNGLAYEKNGGVYLDVRKKEDFGKLSGFSEEKMLEIAKDFEEDIENKDKRHPLDITLWRPTESTQAVHIPSFDSPFGPGRPGWHIECSAMSLCSLGEQIDIHGGGIDLIYPHHESEIAQSEGATGKVPFAKYWLHTHHVSYNGEKMSKSLGNLVMVSKLLEKYEPNAVRYMLLAHHYRESWEFKEGEIGDARKKVKELLRHQVSPHQVTEEIKTYLSSFLPHMENDLSTPTALKALHDLTDEIVTEQNEEVKLLKKQTLHVGLHMLGFIL
ncbi:MAG: cysteine--tRNA ligase [Candidatus Levybacteria bacterium]|nr:cysteine--tRNA ligase [Candidatus Levybacteria bacterium]